MTPTQVVARLRARSDAFTLDIEHLETLPEADDEDHTRDRYAQCNAYRIAIAELRNVADELERALTQEARDDAAA